MLSYNALLVSRTLENAKNFPGASPLGPPPVRCPWNPLGLALQTPAIGTPSPLRSGGGSPQDKKLTTALVFRDNFCNFHGLTSDNCYFHGHTVNGITVQILYQ